MGYLALVLLIGVIIWTLWRLLNFKRLPLDFFLTKSKEESQKYGRRD